MIKKILFIVTLILCNYSHSQTTHPISNPKDIESLSLNPGDIVVLEDGTYNTSETVNFLGAGTAENPITFKSASPGGVVFTGGLKLNIAGSYLIVDGFYWNGGIGASNFITFRNGTDYAENCTIQNCAINNLTVNPGSVNPGVSAKHRWIVMYGNYNNVLNCSFMNKSTSGALILVELEFNSSPLGEDGTENTRCVEVGHTISNNYFYKYEKIDGSLTNSGDSETIRVGESNFQNVNAACTISNNYFVEANGENEIISNKSANNIYVNNTFRRCQGSLVLRHGANVTVERNYFLGEDVEGTGGIRISDSNHNINNNYIQDCISTVENRIWNNGIIFMGSNTSSIPSCTTTSTSNDYQRVDNITVSNNTLINTHSPLFFNTNKGSTDNTGIVENNLIYFDTGNDNNTEVITGDENDSYSSIGQTLTYSGNVFSDTTTLGVTNTGFSETNISLTDNADGETSSHDQSGKGASLGGFSPHTDAMVGDGVGACFLDFEANSIVSPICTVIVDDIETLNIGTLPTFTFEAGSEDASVIANVNWTATEDIDWISISPSNGIGTGDEFVTVTVTSNTESTDRSGVITFTQDDGDITRTLTINQTAQEPRTRYVLINDESANDNVTVASVFHEEVVIGGNNPKNNIAINSLDKDFGTQWSGMNGTNGISPGEIIYDLGGAFDLALIDYATTNGKTYGLQIWASTTGTDEADFVNLFPDTTDGIINGTDNLTSNTNAEFKSFELSTPMENVRYVKIFGYAQASSPWNTITEIEFYKSDSSLSSNDFNTENNFTLYPNPVTGDVLNIRTTINDSYSVSIFDLSGKLLIKKKDVSSTQEINISHLSKGIYFVKTISGNKEEMKKILIAN